MRWLCVVLSVQYFIIYSVKRHSVKTRLYKNPSPYFIVSASSMKTKDVEVIEFHRIRLFRVFVVRAPRANRYFWPPNMCLPHSSYNNSGIPAILELTLRSLCTIRWLLLTVHPSKTGVNGGQHSPASMRRRPNAAIRAPY